jgi:hypothetical protein
MEGRRDDQDLRDFLRDLAERTAHPASKGPIRTEALIGQKEMSDILALDKSVQWYFAQWQAKKRADPDPPAFARDIEQAERDKIVRIGLEVYRWFDDLYGRRDV